MEIFEYYKKTHLGPNLPYLNILKTNIKRYCHIWHQNPHETNKTKKGIKKVQINTKISSLGFSGCNWIKLLCKTFTQEQILLFVVLNKACLDTLEIELENLFY